MRIEGLSHDALQQLVRTGAQTRLAELRQEKARIEALFPDLGGATQQVPVRRGSTLSAAGRKRLSEAQKRRWAKWRKTRSAKD